MTADIQNLKNFDPFAEADDDPGESKQSQNYIHIRIQQRVCLILTLCLRTSLTNFLERSQDLDYRTVSEPLSNEAYYSSWGRDLHSGESYMAREEGDSAGA